MSQRGFTLIELVIVLALFALLLTLGMPAFQDLMASNRVRAAAEGMLNGLQLARAEAIRRNGLVELQIDADGLRWNVVADGATVTTRGAEISGSICMRNTVDGGTNYSYAGGAPCTTSPAFAATTVTFNGVGQMVSPATGFVSRYSSSVSGSRALCVTVTTNTPRMCDPQRTDTSDPAACFSASAAIAGCS